MECEGMQGFCIQARSLNHGGGGAGNNGSGTKCGRWNPTSEQVRVLTELFRAGLRTPSTDQIQKISSQLSFYGKIESKNVFYWFQNHKARERQKRRKVSRDETSTMQERDYERISAPKCYFGEINQVSPEPSEKVIETLQLFPLSSYDECQLQKFKMFTDDSKENTPFSYAISRENDHPTLDLRLSSFL